MRGQIIKRSKDKKSNAWSIVISAGKDEKTGKYRKDWHTFYGTSKEAREELTRLLHEKDTGTYIRPGKTTLAEYLERWLKEYAWPNLSPRTAEGYETVINCHLIPSLGKIPLTKLKPQHIQTYYSDKLINGRYDGKGALNPWTVTKHHLVLHCALEIAVKWGLLTRNPADSVSPPTAQRKEMRTMNVDDVHVFLEAARATPYYALFYLCLYTGMRRSEALALRWSDVDLLMCQVSVNRSLHQLHDRSLVFRQPKTAKGRRLIALPPSAALVLQKHRDEQEKLFAEVFKPDTEDDNKTVRKLTEGDLIFSTFRGNPLQIEPLLPDTVSHAWVKLVRRTGLKGIRLHDARHTFASLMLKNKVHPAVVQQMLGHASITTTIDTYSHIMPGLQEAAAALFDKGLTREPEKAVV